MQVECLVQCLIILMSLLPVAVTAADNSTRDTPADYIAGGWPTSNPSMVSIQYQGHHRCAGTVLDQQHVLTTAKCLQ